ncbi:hypothetical protein GCM10022288_30790 [Gryllotalpicola kribbensis]|uniref:Uncharacterized protein n=1 Tax=Gryllotalpicola kribbensis TaxID=993084 RepID=A0ABP8B0C9_9MICO
MRVDRRVDLGDGDGAAQRGQPAGLHPGERGHPVRPRTGGVHDDRRREATVPNRGAPDAVLSAEHRHSGIRHDLGARTPRLALVPGEQTGHVDLVRRAVEQGTAHSLAPQDRQSLGRLGGRHAAQAGRGRGERGEVDLLIECEPVQRARSQQRCAEAALDVAHQRDRQLGEHAHRLWAVARLHLPGRAGARVLREPGLLLEQAHRGARPDCRGERQPGDAAADDEDVAGVAAQRNVPDDTDPSSVRWKIT